MANFPAAEAGLRTSPLDDGNLNRTFPGDPAGTEYRPVTFMVGSREFDPIKVGFKTSGYNGFLFKTGNKMTDGSIEAIPGNSNAGHEYGTRDEKLPDGSVLPALTQDERWDLVEYLKSL